MAIRPILKMGDARLLSQARPIEDFTAPALQQLLADLRDTMAAHNGAGLAAPQIGEPWQVVLFGSGKANPRYPDAEPVPPTVLINPTANSRVERGGVISITTARATMRN